MSMRSGPYCIEDVLRIPERFNLKIIVVSIGTSDTSFE
jgi:hypothetical protein